MPSKIGAMKSQQEPVLHGVSPDGRVLAPSSAFRLQPAAMCPGCTGNVQARPSPVLEAPGEFGVFPECKERLWEELPVGVPDVVQSGPAQERCCACTTEDPGQPGVASVIGFACAAIEMPPGRGNDHACGIEDRRRNEVGSRGTDQLSGQRPSAGGLFSHGVECIEKLRDVVRTKGTIWIEEQDPGGARRRQSAIDGGGKPRIAVEANDAQRQLAAESLGGSSAIVPGSVVDHRESLGGRRQGSGRSQACRERLGMIVGHNDDVEAAARAHGAMMAYTCSI